MITLPTVDRLAEPSCYEVHLAFVGEIPLPRSSEARANVIMLSIRLALIVLLGRLPPGVLSKDFNASCAFCAVWTDIFRIIRQ